MPERDRMEDATDQGRSTTEPAEGPREGSPTPGTNDGVSTAEPAEGAADAAPSEGAEKPPQP